MSGRCTACRLHTTSQQVVFGEGNVEAQIVAVGEAPGPDEDKLGRPFCGRAGQLFDKILTEVNLKRENIWVTNTAKCFPGRDEKGQIAKPPQDCIDICTERFLFEELKALKPRVILAFGLYAAKALLKTTLPMKDLCGKEFESDWGIVIPLYHPSYFLRDRSDHVAYQQVITGLQRAMALTGEMVTGTYVDQVKTGHHQEDKKVIAELESRSNVFQYTPYPGLPEDREYITAWSDGPKVILAWKDPHGEMRHDVIDDFPWYFYMRTDEVLNVVPSKFWDYWMQKGVVTDLQPDEVNPAWTKVLAYRHIVRTSALKEHLLESYVTMWDDQTVQKFEHDLRLRTMLDDLETYKVQHYEADLTPLRRFMTDYDIKIASAYDELYIDIETDDTLPLGDRRTLAERMILSIAWELIPKDREKQPEQGFLLLGRETGNAERNLLQAFAEEMRRADIMYAWSGNQFDFPILRHRMRKFGVKAQWEYMQTIDLLRTWMRYFQRGATVNTSFALQSIAKHILKQEKIDWKQRARARGLNIHKFIQLYREAPDILEEYNRDDVHKMVELEKFTGFAKIDQVFSRIGNCFARDYHITTKIDSLLLKRGKQAGIHFKTKKVRIMLEGRKAALKEAIYGESGSGYEGAYVLDPKIGLVQNVAALDFKSLYPSVMVAWNISPETYITDEQASQISKDEWVECPTGAKFLTSVKGFIPTIFKDTGEKRRVYQKLQSEQEVGSDMFLLYYRLAYSFKRLGLSFYGDMGNVESRYFNPRVAEAVTLSGQYILKQSIAYAEHCGFEPLYGDTDSMYIKMSREEAEIFVKSCNEHLKKHLWEKFKVPDERFLVELEYENYFARMFFVKKKRYAGLMTMYKGKEPTGGFTEVKGLECMRSDGIEYARQMQRTVIEMIVRHQSGARVILDFIVQQQKQVASGELKIEDITITKGMSKTIESYKSNPPHVRVAKQMRDRGGEFFVGMKIPYIVIGSEKNLEVIHADDYDGHYDASYYWNRLIYPATFRILQAVYPYVEWDLMFIGLSKKRLAKFAQDEKDAPKNDEEESE